MYARLIFNKNRALLRITVLAFAISFILFHIHPVLAEEVTTVTIYPSKFYNIDGARAIKHIFSNGAEIGTVTGTGSEAVPRYTHTDVLTGSSIVTNSADTIDETLDYFPYGSIRVDSGSYSDQRKFAGAEFDDDTGLNYMNARYYDSATGRFISQDPEFLYTNPEYLLDPQQWNSYSYARNNPFKYIDPEGEKVELIGRSVVGIGTHLFFHVVPNEPNNINFNGLPSGTSEFTIGAYNPDRFNPIGNKLVKNLGYKGHDTNDSETGQLKIHGLIEIMTPKGETDSNIINNLGKAYDTYKNDVNYNTLGNINGFYNGNSNNFIYEIGSQAGIGEQIANFNPIGFTPGSKGKLPKTSIYREIKQQISLASNKIMKLIKNKFPK